MATYTNVTKFTLSVVDSNNNSITILPGNDFYSEFQTTSIINLIDKGYLRSTTCEISTNNVTGKIEISPSSAPIRQTIYANFSPRSRVSENNANDMTLQALHSVQVSALPGPNSTVIITPVWSYTNSASVKTLACRFGGSDVGAPTVTTSLTARHFYQTHNANSMQAQKTLNSSSGYLTSNNALIQTSVDTSQPFLIDFRVKWGAAVAGETITLEGVMIELVP